MKGFGLLLISLLLLIQPSCRSEEEEKVNAIQLIKPRQIALNGGLRAAFGGVSRTYLQIDLPPNTVKWYYSFSTSPGGQGTQCVNLMAQLSSRIIDPVGITALSDFRIPEGSNSLAVYLCDRTNIDKFLAKVDLYEGRFNYIMEGTVENTKQAIVEIDDITQGTWFLGIKNPSSMDGVNIAIEVIAITEIKKLP